MRYLLWTVQVLLALLFLFAGGMKLILPIEELTADVPLPGLFVRFIGVVEVLGALGLVLPGLFRIRSELTPLAAATYAANVGWRMRELRESAEEAERRVRAGNNPEEQHSALTEPPDEVSWSLMSTLNEADPEAGGRSGNASRQRHRTNR